MRHDQKSPCAECPYVGKWRGWIGTHESAQEFVDLVRADQPFACHMTVDQEGPGDIVERATAPNVQHCVGYAMFMTKMCKVSRRRELAVQQRKLKTNPPPGVDVLWPPAKLVEWHDGGDLNG